MTSTLAYQNPPLDEYLAKTAPVAHPLLVNTYNKMLGDPSVGKTHAQSMALGNWGSTTQRLKEASGHLQTWVDGASVRVSTVSIYLHLLDLIVASHPVVAPARKARTPSGVLPERSSQSSARGG